MFHVKHFRPVSCPFSDVLRYARQNLERLARRGGARNPICRGRAHMKKLNSTLRFILDQLFREPGTARACIVLVAAIITQASLAGHSHAKDEATPLAIVDFNYNDTSGEPADQAVLHQARLAAFMQAMRSDLTESGKFRLVSLACGSDPCSITQTPSAEILDKARQAGARLLLFGGIHKMSTLIQWAKVQAVDLQTEKLVFDRLLTFRGDTDDAWRRAEVFVAEQMTALEK
jgi:hypothetical protein